MKKILITFAILPLLVSAQLTPDSLLGCYAGTYKYRTEVDNEWTTVYNDTLIVFNYDTNKMTNNWFDFGWELVSFKGDRYYYENDYQGVVTTYGFNTAPFSIDSVIIHSCEGASSVLIFQNNDSVAFYHECWTYPPGDGCCDKQYIRFLGKKYTAQIPDSLLNIYVEENIDINSTIRIFPNPTTGIVNIHLNNAINTRLDIISISGKIIYSTSFNKDTYNINMSRFYKGTYIIKLTNTKETFIQKIIYI